MLEYLALIGQAEREDIPLNQRRGFVEILSRMIGYMSKPEYDRYLAVAESIRAKLAPFIPRGTM